MTILEIIQLIISVSTLIGLIIVVYSFVRKPDEEASTRLTVNESTCTLKHQQINEDIHDIKVNHLAHIEEDIKKLGESQISLDTKFETLLKYFIEPGIKK